MPRASKAFTALRAGGFKGSKQLTDSEHPQGSEGVKESKDTKDSKGSKAFRIPSA